MDHRQNPYSRPQDRPLIHNPNHQPPPPIHHASQPSFQIPPSDPFAQRRAPDPFLPRNQEGRRGSGFGLGSREDGRTASGPAWRDDGRGSNHPTPSSSSRDHQMSQGLDRRPGTEYSSATERRRSIGAQSERGYYAGVSSADPPPPPTAFMSRQMPQPSPSQQPAPMAGPAYQQGPRGPPPPPTFNRELPGLGSRGPGAGMSISSILGDGPAAPPQMHGSGANSASPPSSNNRLASPHRRGQSMTNKLAEFGWRRPHTPDRHHLPAGLRAESTSYSANSSPAHFANARRSPDFGRPAPGLYPQPYQSGASRPLHASPNAPIERDLPGPPPRPNSQPAGLAGEGQPRDAPLSLGIRPPFGQYGPLERREEQRPLYEPAGARPLTVEPLGQPSYSPRKEPVASREVPKEEPRREDPSWRGFRYQNFPPRNGSNLPPAAPRSHPQLGNPFDRPAASTVAPQDRAIPSIDPLSRDDSRRASDLHAQIGDLGHRRVMDEHQPLIMQRSRSSIGLEGKRGSRASPMPQAVQGAQMQPQGHSSDPNIKSEFGRIFQGLGSGLGGSITPSRGSPMPLQRNPSQAGNDVVELSGDEGRQGSLSRPRHKRVKDEMGGEMGSSGKRAKGHHHHMHTHNHPHHHHQHIHTHTHAANQAQPRDAEGGQAHHHHHIHTSHHHHHGANTTQRGSAQPQQPVIASIPKPALTISSSPVLASVAHLPRRHLGSALYSPEITLPPSAISNTEYDTFGFSYNYKPSRTFEESDLNCTFTIRVPRYYLTPEARENVVRNRNIWGSEVCTDDSDPIAMAIHAGWIRGDWGDDVDTSLLDLPDTKPSNSTTTKQDFESLPDAPLIPPQDQDLQITLLILPSLKAYTGSVRFGIRSRDWENKEREHDGVSVMVMKIRLVDEGLSSGVLRSGKGRRERIESRQREAAMALVGLATVGKAVPVAVA